MATKMWPMQLEERLEANKQLQKRWVGQEIRPDTHIIDVGQTSTGEIYVLCYIPNYSVHKFVTWGMDITKSTYWGHYCFTLAEALDDLNERLGLKNEQV